MLHSIKLKQAVQYLSADDYQDWDLCEIMKRRLRPTFHLSAKQVLQRYKINRQQLRQLEQRQLLKPIRRYKNPLWCKDDLDLLLENDTNEN